MKHLRHFFLMAFLLITITTSCKNTNYNKNLPTPIPGTANIIGKFINLDNQPYKSLSVRLAEVYWQGDQGAYVLDESFSPGSISNENGSFEIFNVPEGDYVLIVGTPPVKDYLAITESNGKIKIIHVEQGNIIDLGNIILDY